MIDQLNLKRIGQILPLCLLLLARVTAAESDLSLGVFGGYESHDVEFKVSEGNVDLLFEPEDSGSSIGLLLGYELNPNWSLTGEYAFSDADDVEIQQIYGSLNYHIPISEPLWALKVGVVAGYSELEWQEDPVATLEREPESDQWVAGVQTELEYTMGPNWRLSVRYQYWGTEHKTKIRTLDGSATVRHEDQQHFLIGLTYHF